jgi:hypothetical protein
MKSMRSRTALLAAALVLRYEIPDAVVYGG